MNAKSEAHPKHPIGEEILQSLRAQGHRITSARQAMVTLFVSAASEATPLSVAEVDERLLHQGVRVNRTTVYREIDFLKSQEIIRELHIGDGAARYELRESDSPHHHHLVCLQCSRVECVEMARCLSPDSGEIAQRRKFKVLDHALQLYGLCEGCQ